ncbi:MAG: 4-(cytidine 5'-diphospho)-2-C-methyl-D-erythritol kinase [Actinomadura sp.]
MSVRVPAKVNLQLSVGPIRDDGYHDLVNVFHAVSLFDEVTATPADALEVQVEGDSVDGVPTGADNLAARAARLLAERIGVAPHVRLRIHKTIPVAGGMAGGSADAAGALVACNELWEAGLGQEELMELAAVLGSDVPFALLGGTALGLGRGERLTETTTAGRFHWVFAFAEGGLSTPEVYAECDRLREAYSEQCSWPRPCDELMAALAAGDAKALGRALSNDLQPAALMLRPALKRTLTAGRDFGALGALLSGSGPTCAFLASSETHALDLAVAMGGVGVCRSVKRAHGPVPGATVV